MKGISLLILWAECQMLIILLHKIVRSTGMAIKLIWKMRFVRQVELLTLKPLSHIRIRKHRFLQVISIPIL
ncbi:Uncharacterised protein [Mycobacteroides abscessus subsp. abscessus]|nr:Uncharacterised protein [Mycobacteroides abscessus subsp. abscessus]